MEDVVLMNEKAKLEILELKSKIGWMDLVQGEYGDYYLVNGERVERLTDVQRSYIEGRGVRNGLL